MRLRKQLRILCHKYKLGNGWIVVWCDGPAMTWRELGPLQYLSACEKVREIRNDLRDYLKRATE